MNQVGFNVPFLTGKEFEYAEQAIKNCHLAGNGVFTKKCHAKLKSLTESSAVFLTHSCTAALEMCAILLDLKPGDEVIMPSYTFVSTANAFVLRGAEPVFVDIRPDTLCIDESLIEAAITEKTKAIVVVHYAGVACEMDVIMAIAKKHNLYVVEDAAQAIMSTYKGRPLGSIGHLGALSFHETKNIISGEGGALLVNDESFIERAEYIWEKGTNRKQFFTGQVDKYTWVDVGSSFLPSDLIAAFLYAQLKCCDEITQRRLKIWQQYHEVFAQVEQDGLLRRPIVPKHTTHNGHLYYLLLESQAARNEFIKRMNAEGVNVVFHYIPLHSSPAGGKYARVVGSMVQTDSLSARLVRLPFWIGVEQHIDKIVKTTVSCLRAIGAGIVK